MKQWDRVDHCTLKVDKRIKRNYSPILALIEEKYIQIK